ncbi:hypothetical protein SPRG_09984 [Saprolegnia parasitica CBS 223.65]|uniref:Uncharacterized protein n=1 Tax=Saprolegnia parasitica (strain CBS 223.65) TaxID=695850 RepID=A0A067C9J4_SAPPC|nr:hypothetical protein SPRG_09984 [Saprolegnia parasitica CBS 223.65]KDO23176.1 hypothetical protein SPRG_09984 [Saprolegnia parasitica CBS 223.65]|eukprot:XP_012206128.1 hypothetical protein SPRG_09984 [Saprolegnia parasitica CBS 223.65]
MKASTAAYEAAYNLLPEPTVFAAIGALPHAAPILLTLAGMDEPLSWPLGAAQAQQIAALNAEMVLSHLVVDDVGDAESFRLRPTADEVVRATTFGVAIVLPPSMHQGGALTLTHSGQSQTFDDETPLVETAFAATYLSTTITSEAITSGRRVALVYRLYCVDGPVHLAPPTLEAATAAFKALAQSPIEGIQRLGKGILSTSSHDALSFESLGMKDKMFVDALLATGCFDVSLAPLYVEPQGRDCHVKNLRPHPACNMPHAVARHWRGQSIQGFLFQPPRNSSESPSSAIVFAPKRYRASIVDVGGLFAFLEKRLGTQLHEDGDASHNEDDAYLGVADTRELVLAAMPVFGIRSASHVRTMQTSHLESMTRILVALNDVELSRLFLSDYIMVQHRYPLLEIAPFVYRLLTKHGWEPLSAAMLGLVQRWATENAIAALQLVTSLAGLEPFKPLCPPLQQPFEAELFKRCYHALLATPNVWAAPRRYERSHIVLEEVLVLEHYVQVTAPQLQEANYMSQRLPLPFVAVIDAYLFEPSAVLQFALPDQLLRVYAVALASAMRRQPSLPLAVDIVDGILEAVRTLRSANTYRIYFHACYVLYRDAAAAVLFLASHTRRLDAALFDACVAVWGLALFRTIASVQPHLADTTLLGQLALAYIDAVLETLAVETAWPEWLPRPTEEDKDWVQMGAVIFLDVLHLLEQLAPAKMVTVATMWLQALPTTRNALHGHLLPVLARLDEGSPVYRLLATAAIARSTHLPPLPVVAPAFAIAPPEDLNPDHCQQCNHVHAFYSQADTLAISCGWDDRCSTLARIVSEDDARVSVRRYRVIYEGFSIEKLGPNAEWRAYLEQGRIAAHVAAAAAVEALKGQMSGKHNHDQENDDAPLVKRVRRA